MVSVIKALDIVPDCYTWQSGDAVARVIRDAFLRDQAITISFAGVTDVPTSFVNAAFIALLDDFTFDFIKGHLKLVNCTRQIADVVRRRFDFELTRPKAA